MCYIKPFFLCFILVVWTVVSSQAQYVQGRYYTVYHDDEAVRSGGGTGIDVLTRRPGFTVHEFGDAEIVRWAVGVLEYELTQEAIDKKLKAYFYLPKLTHDDIESGDTIDFHITNASALTLQDIADRSNMVLAATIDARAHLESFTKKSECSDGWNASAFETDYPFSACNYKPVEIDFFAAQNTLKFKAGDTLTIVVSLRNGYWFATTVGGTSDPYGFFAAGVRLSDRPLQPMAASADVERCDGKKPTILGTHNDDTIHVPSQANHVVLGLRGDDVIFGTARADRICGGNNNDKIHGNDGDDYLNGGNHSDMILAGNGNDKVVDNSGSNTLIGAGGNDHITGSSTSTCVGNGGRDRANKACGVTTDIETVQ